MASTERDRIAPAAGDRHSPGGCLCPGKITPEYPLRKAKGLVTQEMGGLSRQANCVAGPEILAGRGKKEVWLTLSVVAHSLQGV